MTRAIVVLVVLALASPFAATAQAQQTNAPPGNSAIDEYLETVPGSTGNERPRAQATPGSGGGSNGLSAAERARLERLGPDGKVLADAVDRTAPAAKFDSSTSNGVAGARTDGRSPLGEVFGTVTGNDGGGGMGIFLPGILIAALLAAIAVVLLRRRTTA